MLDYDDDDGGAAADTQIGWTDGCVRDMGPNESCLGWLTGIQIVCANK